MTKFDKLLLALTAAGIWALVIQNAVQPSIAEDQLSKRSIQRIIESCEVYVERAATARSRADPDPSPYFLSLKNLCGRALPAWPPPGRTRPSNAAAMFCPVFCLGTP
jgi:hypothetical protein